MDFQKIKKKAKETAKAFAKSCPQNDFGSIETDRDSLERKLTITLQLMLAEWERDKK